MVYWFLGFDALRSSASRKSSKWTTHPSALPCPRTFLLFFWSLIELCYFSCSSFVYGFIGQWRVNVCAWFLAPPSSASSFSSFSFFPSYKGLFWSQSDPLSAQLDKNDDSFIRESKWRSSERPYADYLVWMAKGFDVAKRNEPVTKTDNWTRSQLIAIISRIRYFLNL